MTLNKVALDVLFWCGRRGTLVTFHTPFLLKEGLDMSQVLPSSFGDCRANLADERGGFDGTTPVLTEEESDMTSPITLLQVSNSFSFTQAPNEDPRGKIGDC